MSIVGNDEGEEVVAKAVPTSILSPGIKAKPLRAPLRERTNARRSARGTESGGDGGELEEAREDAETRGGRGDSAAAAAATARDRASSPPAKGAAVAVAVAVAEPSRKKTSPGEGGEDARRRENAALAAFAAGLDALRGAGLDAKEALLGLCRNPNKPNAREAASTVVARLIAALDERRREKEEEGEEGKDAPETEEVAPEPEEVARVRLAASESPPEAAEAAEEAEAAEAAEEAEVAEAAEETEETKEAEAAEAAEAASSASSRNDSANDSDSDEVFATANPSPAGSAVSAIGLAAAAVDAVDASALTNALEAMTMAPTTKETYTVEEGVLGCGEGCGDGEDGAPCEDPVKCLAKKFAAAGGPFQLPARRRAVASEAASTKEDSSEPPPSRAEPPPSRAPPVESERPGPEREDAASDDDDDASDDSSASDDGESSETEESVAETEDDADSARAAAADESFAETVSVADDAFDDEEEADAAAMEAAEEAAALEGSPAASPGPEVVDVADLPNGSPLERSRPPRDDASDDDDDDDDDDDAPVSVRKRTPGRSRVVLSDEEEEEEEDTGADAAIDEANEAESPPAAAAGIRTPPRAPAAPVAPPTTGKKKSMLRLNRPSAKKKGPGSGSGSGSGSAREEEDPSRAIAFADDGDAAAALSRTSSLASRTSGVVGTDGAGAAAFPKSALKTRRAPARAVRGDVVASARRKAIAWLDDEAADDSDSGAESDDEGESRGEEDSDDSFVVDDEDEVEYDSDASSAAIEADRSARMTPGVGAPGTGRRATRKAPRGAVAFVDLADEGEEEDDEEKEKDDDSSSSPIPLAAAPADPYEIRTPTPPPKTPSANPKTPKSAFPSRKPSGAGYAGYGEPPPTHSKALAAALASAAKPGKSLNYARHRETIARELYREFNRDGFGGALPETLEISWNAKLLTTAGLTHYRKVTRSSGKSEYHARIELSTKVLDAAEKLEATLLHEMCHAAAWLLDKCAKPPHGSVFKKWATRVMRVYPVVSVDTCHSYAIHQPYKYRCTQSWCRQEYGRHSKSIDVTLKACGVCNGRLEFLGKFNADGTKAEEKKATAFSLFVKEHFGAVKETLPAGTPHKLVMKELSARWKKSGGGAGTTGRKTGAGGRRSRAASPDPEDDDDAEKALEGVRALKL